jgi:phage tail-like protein
MAEKKQAISTSYPLPVYNYKVTINSESGSLVLSFAEVTGLSMHYESVTYKHGMSYLKGEIIVPGMRQAVRVTLKRGVAKSRHDLHTWMAKTYADPGYGDAKRDLVIDLCNETGEAMVRWSVLGAMPVRLDARLAD